MQNELFYKLCYTTVLWLCLCFFYYNYIEELLYYLSQVLNEYLIVKDFQDIITIYIQITSLLAMLLSLFYFYVIYLNWRITLKYKTEKKNYQIFLILYLMFTVAWIAKQDLFFSNWEIFLLNAKNIFFDIQPDFYIFFQNLIEDLNDFFIITLFIYFYYLIFLYKKEIKIKIMFQFRMFFYAVFLLYFIYFFSCETLLNFFSFITISCVLTEFLLYTKYILVELKKLITKSKYF